MCKFIPSHYACFDCRISLKGNETCPNCCKPMKNMGYKFKSPRKAAVIKWRKLEESDKTFGGCGCDFGKKPKTGWWHTQQNALKAEEATWRFKEYFRAFSKLVGERVFTDDRAKALRRMKLTPEKAAEFWLQNRGATDAEYIASADQLFDLPHIVPDGNDDTYQLYRRARMYGVNSLSYINW